MLGSEVPPCRTTIFGGGQSLGVADAVEFFADPVSPEASPALGVFEFGSVEEADDKSQPEFVDFFLRVRFARECSLAEAGGVDCWAGCVLAGVEGFA
jgi:hypothetical protein